MQLFNRAKKQSITPTAPAAHPATTGMKEHLKFIFQGHEIRVAGTPDAPLFCGKDVATCLGYVNHRDALAKHCKGSRDLRLPSNGGLQPMKFISESDLYRLISRSRAKNAEPFQDWVVEEVLPGIRQSGHYQDPAATTPIIGQLLTNMQQLLANHQALIEAQQGIISTQQDHTTAITRLHQRIEQLESQQTNNPSQAAPDHATRQGYSNHCDLHELVKTLYIQSLRSQKARIECTFQEIVTHCYNNQLFLAYIDRAPDGTATPACRSRFGRYLSKNFPGKLWRLDQADVQVHMLGKGRSRRYIAAIT